MFKAARLSFLTVSLIVGASSFAQAAYMSQTASKNTWMSIVSTAEKIQSPKGQEQKEIIAQGDVICSRWTRPLTMVDHLEPYLYSCEVLRGSPYVQSESGSSN